MATITGYTAARMQAIENASVVSGVVTGDNLILTKFDATQINAGNVRGPQGIAGPTGPVPEAPLNTTTYGRKNGAWVSAEGVRVVTSATRPASPPEGTVIYETDTDEIYSWNGTAWTLPSNVAGGLIGNASVIAAQGVTTEADLTGLSITVPVMANRQIKVSFQVNIVRTIIDGYNVIRIKEGVTNLLEYVTFNSIANIGESFSGYVIITPTVGVHTYKLTLMRGSGTGTTSLGASAASPAYITAEDVGVV